MRQSTAQQTPQVAQDCGGLRLTVTQHDSHTVVFSIRTFRRASSCVAIGLIILLALLVSVCLQAPIFIQVLLAAAAAAGAALWAAAVVEEVLTAVQGLGVVLSARRRCWWRPASTFVPAERIRHVIINEGVGASRVTCYLAFMVEGSDRLEVAFPRLLPRLPLLTPVYQQLHARLGGGSSAQVKVAR